MTQSTTDQAIERLRLTSPYAPEPPARSRIVSTLMWLANRRQSKLETPHLHGGSDAAKVQYEYDGAQDFWDRIAHVIPLKALEDRDVLDVGCGWGGKMIYWGERASPRSLKGFDIPGFDPEIPAAVAHERGLENVSFTTGLAEHMPYGSDSFDIAIMDDVMEHVQDPQKVLAECRRVLRPGGMLLCKYPSFKMMKAHHFDRALSLPGLHYLLSMRTWAAGLNWHLITHPGAGYEPFSRVITTKYQDEVTSDLNGIDWTGSRQALCESGFEIVHMEMLGLPPRLLRSSPVLPRIYNALRRVPVLHEFLASSIFFVARK